MIRTSVRKLNNGVALHAPTADGANGAAMVTNGSGQLSFTASALGTAAFTASSAYDAAGAASAAQTAAIAACIQKTSNVLFTNGDGTLNSLPEVVSFTTASKTMALTDANTVQDCNSAVAQTATIPLNATVNFPVGTTLVFQQTGAGTLSVNCVSGVTINGVDSNTVTCGGQWNALVLRQRSTNAWVAGPISGALVITAASVDALAVGANGITNPALQVDTSATNVATGVKLTGAAAAGGFAIATISSGTNENLTVDSKGSGQLTLNGTATGPVIVGHASAGLRLMNTTDQVTNPEYAELVFSSNNAILRTNAAGTGTVRTLYFDYGNSGTHLFGIPNAATSEVQFLLGSIPSAITNGRISYGRGTNNSMTSGTHATILIGENWVTSSNSAGTFRSMSITPTINLTGATKTGGYTAIHIAATETSLGTGSNYLIHGYAGAAGTTEVFALDNTGTVKVGAWNGSVIGSNYGGAGSVNGIMQANGSGVTSAVTVSGGLSYSAGTLTTNGTKTLAMWTITNSSGIATGVQTAQIQVPVASTITGWVLTLDAGTATVDIYKQAYSSSTTPSTSIVGAGTKPNVASGITNEATSISGWTTTAVAANDQMVINITAAATCKSLILQLIGTN